MNHAFAVQPAPLAKAPGPYVRLQRRCAACGGTGAREGTCDECKAKAQRWQAKLTVGAADDAFEREADAMAQRVLSAGPASPSSGPVAVQRLGGDGSSLAEETAPPEVEQVVASPGRPMDPQARAYFEPRFGHDFGNVRLHHDGAAARSAARVHARAYTVGEHVVFGQGAYGTDSAAGRALMAHELTHVLQQRPVVQRAVVQRGVVQRDSISPPPRFASGDGKEEDDEARQASAAGATVQRSPLRVQRLEGDDPLAGPWPEKDEAAAIMAQDRADRECVNAAGPDPLDCDPAADLTWADFAGTPGGGTFSAATHSGLRERAINIADRRCRPSWAPADMPARGVQAFFTSSRSWVRANAGSGASDPALNGCNAVIAACHASFAANQTGFHMLAGPVPGCAASAQAAGTPATTDDECDTLVAADCNGTRVAESARLLNHEQVHFNLSCAMARKANAMLASAPSFEVLLRAAQTTLARQQNLYDVQTRHGCNGGSQATWETAINDGLPDVTITLPTARRRR